MHADDDVGGAIGMYPNGLQIIRDIDPHILSKIRAAGTTFCARRWMRHDGSTVAVGNEKYICNWENEKDKEDRASLGIRRWRLQKILLEACVAAQIPIAFGERLAQLTGANSERIQLRFDSGRLASAQMVSKLRSLTEFTNY